MLKNMLTSIEGIAIYPSISIVIFFTLFVGVLYWTWSLKQTQVDEMAHLPLEAKDTFVNGEDSNG